MVAVPFGGVVRFLPVAAPTYLARFGMPHVPDDLHKHRCIRHRLPSGKTYRWEFEKHGQQLVLDVPGVLTVNNNRLMVMAAADGMGVAFVYEAATRADIAPDDLSHFWRISVRPSQVSVSTIRETAGFQRRSGPSSIP